MGHKTIISEGVIRVDNGKMNPTFYKSKSFNFKIMEGICQVDDPGDAA